MVVHLLVSSLAAKGKGATAKGGRKGAETKVFAARKSFGECNFTPWMTTRRGATTSPPREDARGMASPGEQDAHTRQSERRGDLKATHQRRGEGVPDGTAGEAAAFDLSHQTLAVMARTPEGFGGAWRVRQQPPWRSGARRPDSSAGREPKGAIALPCFRVMPITELQLRKLTSRMPVMIAGKE